MGWGNGGESGAAAAVGGVEVEREGGPGGTGRQDGTRLKPSGGCGIVLPMMSHSESDLLAHLRARGAVRLQRIRFRRNRRTIWSLTGAGTVLNLHSAYREAPPHVLEAFAVIAREALRRTPAFRKAAQVVRGWEGLLPEMFRSPVEHPSRRTPPRRPPPRKGPCCATAAQIAYLEGLYAQLNRTRFEGRLPEKLPIRLSARMRSRMGHMLPGWDGRARTVVELALNPDLMLEGNGRDRVDTLAHEMAHAAHWLFEGGRGHGPDWRRWARVAGCEPRACTRSPIRRRDRGIARVTRVPDLPEGA